MRFELVIFDCDGVLVDSERITNRVFAGLLRELGLDFTFEQMIEHFVGLSLPQCVAIMTELLGHAPPADFAERFRSGVGAALARELTAMPGIETVLDSLTIPCCVASNGERQKMRATLAHTGLLSRFEGRLFNVSDVANPKPAPDIYLYAAARCNTEPRACAVIEDTPTGVAAGAAAGMTVFGYAGLIPPQRLLAAGAHVIFHDMQALPELLSAHTRK